MATLMATTVSDILQQITDLRGESSLNTDAVRIRAVTRAEQEVASRKLFQEHLLLDQTVASTGVNAYTIGSATYPMRKKGLHSVYVGDTLSSSQHKVISHEDFRTFYNQSNSAKVAYEYYDAANDLWKMYISPTPENGVTITYSYYFLPPTRTLTTDLVISPNADIVARLALAYILEGEEEYDLADSYKNESEQMISELIGLDQQPNSGGVNTFRSVYRGLGTY
jgi:hypothetical protein